MSCSASIKFYLNLFYALGLSSHEPSIISRFVSICKFSKFIQAIICALTSILALNILNFNAYLNEYTTTESIILHTYFFCDIIRTTVVLLQCLMYKSANNAIIENLDSASLYFAQQLQHLICYRAFRRSFNFRILIIIGASTLYIILFFVRLQAGDSTITRANLFTKFLQFMTAFCYTHHIFYIDLLSFHLAQLNMVIEREIPCSINVCRLTNKDRIKKQIKSYKFIHFRLYLISQRMNKCFGYSLVAVLLHASSDLIYSSFWIFQMINKSRGILFLWSKLTN